MSSAPQWKPGTVGVAGTGERFMVTLDGSCAWDSLNGDVVSGSPNPEDRPLVVIDPEDREQVERLFKAFDDAVEGASGFPGDLQQALRNLIAPPRPEEPQGLGAVVEDAEGEVWVHLPNGPHFHAWKHPTKPSQPYSNIKAVRVLSEGWRA